MKISEIGEFGLIALLAEINSHAVRPPGLVMGIGDDAAAWKSLPGMTLATTDCMVQGVHFTPSTTGYFALGWKALATNLSDIAAMGGIADYALLNLGLPPDTETEDILSLFRGISSLATERAVFVCGGNTSRSDTFFVNITVLGHATGPIMIRSGANPGDLIAVTGRLGAAAAGWRLLQQKRHQNGGEPLISAFLKPVPRLEEGQILAGAGITTCIDVSDGLAADLTHLCLAGGVGAEIRLADLPVDPAATTLFGEHATELAINGGEDYELLFTGAKRVMDSLSASKNLSFTAIGEIIQDIPGKIIFRDSTGDEHENQGKGWQHFGAC